MAWRETWRASTHLVLLYFKNDNHATFHVTLDVDSTQLLHKSKNKGKMETLSLDYASYREILHSTFSEVLIFAQKKVQSRNYF